MRSLNISRRLALMSFFGLLATLTVGLVGAVQMGRIKSELDQVQQRYVPAIEAARLAALSFSNVRRASVLYTNAATDALRTTARGQVEEGVAAQRKQFEALQNAAIGLDGERGFVEQETKLSAQYLAMMAKLVADLEAPGADRGAILSQAPKLLGPVGGELLKTLDAHSRFYDELMHASVARADERYASSLWLIGGCTVLGLAVLALWSWGVYLRVVKPLDEVRGIVTRVEEQKDFRVAAAVRGDDEVGQMLTAFNRLLGAMRGAIRDTGESAHEVSETARALDASSESLSRIVTAQSEAASSIAAAMEEMSVSASMVATQARDVHDASRRAGEMADSGASVIATAVHEIDSVSEAVSRSAALMSELEAHS